MQRRQVFRISGVEHGLLGRARLLEGEFRGERDERAHLVAKALRAREVVLGEFDRRHLAATDRGGLLERGEVMEGGHACDPSGRGRSQVRRCSTACIPTPLR